ncbi:MAG: hypothetical protein L7F78_19495, partial [Syntrophales bacterium LBB04]|nr:hypothetical protein [Syntrophales bacterium LBB04]
ETVNRRVQDGIKTYLLCGDCEQLLGVWENSFAKEIFVPLHEGGATNVYGHWLLKFSVSISWRILTYFKECLDLNHFSEGLLRSADNALNVWQEFLVDKRPHPDAYGQHMLPFRGFIADRNDPALPSNFNQYVSRSVDIDAACSKTHAYVYAKLCRILLVGFIEMNHRERWRDTKVHVKSGTLEKQHYRIPADIRNFMYYKAHRLKAIQGAMSGSQWDKIGEDYRKNSNKFPDSEMFNAITQDFILFGDDAFSDPDNQRVQPIAEKSGSG